ncbi:MAG: acyl-CoA thioesterase [Acidimicrobiia bacterium]
MTGRRKPPRDLWPAESVREAGPQPSAGVDALRADGFRYVADVEAIDADHDEWQDHLNNTAAVRMFNDLRVAYAAANLAPEWVAYVWKQQLTVVVRELHVQYESEGRISEGFVGAMRITRRQGKAGFIEQRLVEAGDARPVARAWIVQLLVEGGRAIDWPSWYWDRVADVEGGPIPIVEVAPRAAFGPP